MAKRKKKSNVYFTKITEIAILAYNKTEKSITREKIYRRFIYPAFMKMAENLINTIKPTIEDITHIGTVAAVYAKANDDIDTIPILILRSNPPSIKNNIPTPTKALIIYPSISCL